jgi:hypothetical protein
MPVRIRLDLTGDRLDTHVLDVVREAAVAAAARAADRVCRADALDGAVWSAARAPEVSVRFSGTAVPAWAAAHLEAGAHAAAQAATARLRQASTAVAPPVRTTWQLRRFATDAELLAALDVVYGDRPRPARVIVVAADGGGTSVMVFVDTGADGFPMVTWGVRLNRFVLPADGRDAEAVPGYGVRGADSLHLVAVAADEAGFQKELAAALVRIWHAATPDVAESRLADRAAARAKRYRLTGSLYEYRYGGTPVAWFNGPAGLTDQAGLPLLVFTEEVAGRPTRYGSDCPPLRYDATAAGNADPARPFLHELEVSDWDADEFGDLIDTIAGELGTPKPRFIGSFLFAALDVIRQRSESLGSVEGTQGRQGELRRLVKGLEALNVLFFAYTKAVLARDRARKLPCPLAGQAPEWATFLHRDYFPARRKVVASLFVAACQDALLENLEKSAADIAYRLGTSEWLPATRVVLTSLLADLPELTGMLEKLRKAKAHNDGTARFTPEPGHSYASIDGVEVVRTPVFPGRDVPGRDPFRTGYRIKDPRGTWHTLEEVETAVQNLRTAAQLTDPFLEKLADIKEVVAKLREAERLDRRVSGAGTVVTAAVDGEFFAVLREIGEINRKKTKEVREDRMVAFGLATFQPEGGNDLHAKLSGVHQQADLRLSAMFTEEKRGTSAFGDVHIYREGLAALAGHQIAKARFREFFELAGLTALAVFFPWTAFAIGVLQAVEGRATAHEHADVQRAMLSGEDLLSREQVETELAAARLQLFLAVVPELPAAVRDALAGARALARGELKGAAAAAMRNNVKHMAAHLAAFTAERFVKSFLTQLTTGYVISLALSEVVGEYAAAVAADYRTGGTVARADIAAHVSATMAAAVAASVPSGEH